MFLKLSPSLIAMIHTPTSFTSSLIGQLHSGLKKTWSVMASFHTILLTLPVVSVIVKLVFHLFKSEKKSSQDNLTFEPDPNVVNNAGVLPIRFDGGKVQYLLGKEAFGVHEGTWADFGGKREGTESARQTAARECFEELKGLLGSVEQMFHKLEKAPYIETRFPRKDQVDYRMYFLFVENSNHVTQDSFLKQEDTTGHGIEKSRIAWVDAEDITQVIQNIYIEKIKAKPIFIVERGFEKLRHPFCRTLSMNYGQNLQKLLDFGASLAASQTQSAV